MHANWQHLSANLFNLCVFGKLVEETEGAWGVVFVYAVTAAGAAAVSVLTQPHLSNAVSVGASGAVFGLFAVSVLTRLSLDPRRLLEAAILGNFVVGQVLVDLLWGYVRVFVLKGRVGPNVGGGGDKINHPSFKKLPPLCTTRATKQ